MDAQEIYFTLAGEDASACFEDTLTVLDDYFIPKANVLFQTHLIRQIAQEMDEIIDQFVCRLRQRSGYLIFGDNKDDPERNHSCSKSFN